MVILKNFELSFHNNLFELSRSLTGDRGTNCFVLSCFVKVERGSKDLKPKTNEKLMGQS